MSTINQKSYNKLSSANKYALAQQNKKKRYLSMSASDDVINWSTTHHAYNHGLTKLGRRCAREGVSWVQ